MIHLLHQQQNRKEQMENYGTFEGKASFFNFEELERNETYNNQAFSLKFISSIKQIPSFPQLDHNYEHIGRQPQPQYDTCQNDNLYQSQVIIDTIQSKEDSEDGSYNTRDIKAVLLQNTPTALEVPTPKKGLGCNCKKTGCLKMYCQCFSSGKVCSGSCNCSNCSNSSQKVQVLQKARQIAKSKNKFAFHPVDGSTKRHCNCKKTQCQKKYCECYNVGQLCNQLCKCQDCLNGTCNLSHQ